jgi:hypothetical protein
MMMYGWSPQQYLIRGWIALNRAKTLFVWCASGQGANNHTFPFQIVTWHEQNSPKALAELPASGRRVARKNNSQRRREWQPMLAVLPATGQPRVSALYALCAALVGVAGQHDAVLGLGLAGVQSTFTMALWVYLLWGERVIPPIRSISWDNWKREEKLNSVLARQVGPSSPLGERGHQEPQISLRTSFSVACGCSQWKRLLEFCSPFNAYALPLLSWSFPT